MTIQTVIPPSEVWRLTNIVINNFNTQYLRAIDPSTVTPQFITPRINTLYGFEVVTMVSGSYLKIRLYITGFPTSAGLNPFRLEEIQDENTGYGEEVYVTISDLPVSQFPNLSKAVNPIVGQYDENGIALEDLSGYILTENGSIFEIEH